ncbi:fungal-specific transcription factor domain-containing protein [Podospora conica]|nr:fungal-specific transcription factor domain-containing protein [Schizothecium conicum]
MTVGSARCNGQGPKVGEIWCVLTVLPPKASAALAGSAGSNRCPACPARPACPVPPRAGSRASQPLSLLLLPPNHRERPRDPRPCKENDSIPRPHHIRSPIDNIRHRTVSGMEPLPESSAISSVAPPPPPTVPRACDPCRTRKIRCDREVPCSHCKQAKIDCSINLESRPKEKRAARVLVTPQYEKKIDHIDRRLELVVRLLQDIKAQIPPSASNVPSPDSASTGPSIKVTPPVASPACHSPSSSRNEAPDASVVEGDSSLTAHSTFANNLLLKVVGQLEDPSRLQMGETLDTLRHLVDAMKQQPASHEMTYPNAQSLTLSASAMLKGLELPPIKDAVKVLGLATANRSSALSWIFEAFPADMFPEMCMRVYFSDDYNISEYIIVNAGLHVLFWASDRLTSAPDADAHIRYAIMCGKNIEVALANLPLHMPTDLVSIMALMSGAMYAVELSKPSLAWILTAKASELCQTLGYHRIDTFRNENQESAHHKQFVFWAVYVISQGLCLRLGRCSTIQDYDITIPYPYRFEPHRRPICALSTSWIRAAKLQGEIYERLYCPDAITQPENVRRSRVQALVRSSEEVEAFAASVVNDFEATCIEIAGEAFTRFFNTADKVIRLAMLCTILRAVPNPPGSSTTFSDECIAAARASLDEHHACMDINNANHLGLFATYMNWTILFCPFVPYITLFVNVIETLNRDDLSRLRAFLASISSSEQAPETEAVVKTRRLFQVLYNVALHYVENASRGKESAPRSVTQAEPDGVDAYLATLGLCAQGVADTQHQQREGYMAGEADESLTARGVNPMLWMSNGSQLEDWFYSNQQMMDLEFALDADERF